MRALRTTPSPCRVHASAHTTHNLAAHCSRAQSSYVRRVRGLHFISPLQHKRSTSHITRIGEVAGDTVPYAVLDDNIRWLVEDRSSIVENVEWFRVEAFVNPAKCPDVLFALHDLGIYGASVQHSEGGPFSKYRADTDSFYVLPNGPYKDFVYELVTDPRDRVFLTLQIQQHLLNTAMRAIGGGLHTGEPGDVKIFTRLYSKPFNENFREPILYCVCKNCG